MFDVAIIGGGAAGFGAALTLSSVENKFPWAKNREYLLIDDNNSDIAKARFYNLAGVEFGIGGDDLLIKMKGQLANYESVDFVNDTVIEISGEHGSFEIKTKTSTYDAKIIVLATGMHQFDIKLDDIEILPHTDVMKPNKIRLKHSNYKIRDGVYVAGLASGSKTMFAIANGDGVNVACDIFREWTDKPVVAHDSLKN